jgi:hypothetical protein
MPPAPREFAFLDDGLRRLQKANTLKEIKDLRDRAIAARVYLTPRSRCSSPSVQGVRGHALQKQQKTGMKPCYPLEGGNSHTSSGEQLNESLKLGSAKSQPQFHHAMA